MLEWKLQVGIAEGSSKPSSFSDAQKPVTLPD